MTPLASVVSLFRASTAAASNPAPPAPTGAPTNDYQFVAWCYGALSGYLDLHDEVMPEVTRIESTWRRPGSKLADDLKVYETQQRQGRADLKTFQAALTAAEKASMQPINAQGAVAVRRGRAIWNAGPEVTKARKAQEWMSWALPARCDRVAANLTVRSQLAGAALRANQPKTPPPSATDEPNPAEAPAAESTAKTEPPAPTR